MEEASVIATICYKISEIDVQLNSIKSSISAIKNTINHQPCSDECHSHVQMKVMKTRHTKFKKVTRFILQQHLLSVRRLRSEYIQLQEELNYNTLEICLN